ncbi:unnamed protein product [Prunus armeniaca]|uniref:Uncharacterized protein n=1 Tax=Prunus armeniaca TaxID=36596 RepID=A0A6J5TWI8_PRUAR|nr:unnamed protein product [Prunus armeniaca]
MASEEVRPKEIVPEEANPEEAMAKDPTKTVIEELAPVVESTRLEGELLASDPKDTEVPLSEGHASPNSGGPESENVVPDLIVEPVVRTEDVDDSSASWAKRSGTATMSKERAKILLAKWVTLSTEERVTEEQSVKVCCALDALGPTYPDFASSFENAKSDMLALANKFKHSGPAQPPDDLAQLEAELARLGKRCGPMLSSRTRFLGFLI